MMTEGLTEAEARQRIWLVDSRGLVVKGRDGLTEHKLPYAHEHAPVGDFLSAIQTLKPTAIIGVAAVGGTFTPEVLRTMAELNEQPIVFALSNPTSKAECSAEEAYRHTDGRALFACGSPYDPVTIDGKTFVPRQGNNSYIFPGVGLGAIASGARLITDEMFMAAARTLAQLVTEADLEAGQPLPGAAAHSRSVGAHRGGGCQDRLQTRPGERASAEEHARLCQIANLRAALLSALDASRFTKKRDEPSS